MTRGMGMQLMLGFLGHGQDCAVTPGDMEVTRGSEQGAGSWKCILVGSLLAAVVTHTRGDRGRKCSREGMVVIWVSGGSFFGQASKCRGTRRGWVLHIFSRQNQKDLIIGCR